MNQRRRQRVLDRVENAMMAVTEIADPQDKRAYRKAWKELLDKFQNVCALGGLTSLKVKG